MQRYYLKMEHSYENIQKRKFTLIAILSMMAKADEKLHDFELNFLRDTAQKMSVEMNDFETIWQSPESHIQIKPSSELERMQFFFHALSMMNMDSHASNAEELCAKKVGLHLGLRPDMTGELIEVFKKDIHGNNEPDAIEKVLLKYAN